MAYTDTIEYLYGLQKHGIKLGLANSEALMEALGAPHRRFRSVHIAGTNGKGSTAAFLASMLRAAGLRTGLYTSPHLVSFTERIRVDGTPVSEQEVVELADLVREAWRSTAGGRDDSCRPTFFEVTTAMAFVYFARKAVDVAVVEVGMGGRLDATNVITPLVSVITTIDLEHTEFLGASLEAIAGEKAGIIKPRVPAVTGVGHPAALAVIEERARSLAAPLFRRGKEFSAARPSRERFQSFDYRGISGNISGVSVSMTGAHQIDNACLALAAVECLAGQGIPVDEAAIRKGLSSAQWEGRLERVAERPDVVLDGAHNPAAARVLAAAVRELKASYERCILVVGILADKDSRGILSELAPLADRLIVTRPSYSRAMDPAVLAAQAREVCPSVLAEPSLEGAIARARSLASARDLILITGSLYVVGDARAILAPGGDRRGVLQGLTG